MTPHGLLYEDLVIIINRAITKNRKLLVQIGQQSPIEFSPVSVFHDFEDGRKNVIGFTDKRLWSFRIDRLSTIKVTTSERVIYPYTQAFRIPTAARPQKIILRFHLETVSLAHQSKLRARLERETAHLQKQIDVEANGWCFTCTICDPFATLPWIKSFGALVEIIEPSSLRERMIAQLQTMQKRYAEVT